MYKIIALSLMVLTFLLVKWIERAFLAGEAVPTLVVVALMVGIITIGVRVRIMVESRSEEKVQDKRRRARMGG